MSGGDKWERVLIPFQKFRRAATQAEMWHLVDDSVEAEGTIDHQWARFRSDGQDGRWTNQALPYLLDIFPVALSRLERLGNEMLLQGRKSQASSDEAGDSTPFWFPTLALQADFRKELPREGVEWLYSHIQFRSITNGRTNINITILDIKGDVIVYTSQTGLIMNSSRNVGLIKKENL
jgi:acyl-CoA thioesterase